MSRALKPAFLVACALVAQSAFASSGEMSFTPSSILVPIRGIELEGDSHGQIYSCPADSESGCMVDIADSAALEALVSSSTASVDPGSYTAVRIYTCKSEGGYNVKLKGAVTIGSTSYVTSSGSDPIATSGTADYVTVPFTGCATSFTLPAAVSVTESSSITISLFVTLANIAWATDSNGTTIPSGCKKVGSKAVCMAYPNVVPYAGTTEPTLEKYHLRGSGSAGTESGQMLFFFDPSDNFLGGVTRRLFSATSSSLGNFDTPLRTYSKNSDGTLNVANYGSSATSSYMTFPTFSRADHTSTFLDVNNSPVTYTAVKQ